ncbi:MAG: LysE family translocator [Desulfotomaculaceae bacterium]|nr:LysE family translocator [Desulfotomaculaceae bacterium]
MHSYNLFVLTALAAAILPGADFAMVTKNTLALGRKGGQATALGIASGLMVHTTAAVLGLSVIIAKSAFLFGLVKYAGAAYLFYIGITTLISRVQGGISPASSDTPAKAPASQNTFKNCFAQGALTNTLNPKAAIFYMTLLPQFVDPTKDAYLQLAILGLTSVIIVLIWFLFLAGALDYIRVWFNKPMFRSVFQRLTGLVLISFGMKLALEKQ